MSFDNCILCDSNTIKTSGISINPVISYFTETVLLLSYKLSNPNHILALYVTFRPQIILKKLFSTQME